MLLSGKKLEALLPGLKAAIVHALQASAETLRGLRWLAEFSSLDILAPHLVSCEEELRGGTSSGSDGPEDVDSIDDPTSNDGAEVFAALSQEQQHQMLALRGLLGDGVLQHCLSKRHRVDYGTADRHATFLF